MVEHDKGKQYAFVGQYPQLFLCPSGICAYVGKKYNLTMISMSFGKSGGVASGENVYAITYWLDLDNNRTMASVEAIDDAWWCIIFYIHELMLN